MNSDDLSYAKCKQIPDMLRGFRICTNYGDIVITDSEACRVIANAVAAELEMHAIRGEVMNERI